MYRHVDCAAIVRKQRSPEGKIAAPTSSQPDVVPQFVVRQMIPKSVRRNLDFGRPGSVSVPPSTSPFLICSIPAAASVLKSAGYG